MSDAKYNGWTNYETWNWKLWIDNEAGWYEYWQETVPTIVNDAVPSDYLTKEQAGRIDLADALKAESELMAEEMPQAGPFADILNAGLSRINWDEIAASMIEDYQEIADYSESA